MRVSVLRIITLALALTAAIGSSSVAFAAPAQTAAQAQGSDAHQAPTLWE
jgi:hypothetical protein